MSVTMSDVARKAGVSRTTVSFVLNERRDISLASDTRDRVWEAANELGWRPHPVARALRAGRTNLVGFWAPVPATPHYAHLAREFMNLIHADGYRTVIMEAVDPMVAHPLAAAAELPIDGLVAVNLNEYLQGVRRSRIGDRLPVVAVDHTAARGVDSVVYDLAAGAQAAMQHLLGSGRDRIAYLGARTSGPGDARRVAYAEAMATAGLPGEYITVDNQQRATARAGVRRHVAAHGAPEALFCTNDEMAIGAYRGLLDGGVRIPEDTAIVGCDDIEDIRYLDCPLSTIAAPLPQILATAWEFLQARLDNPGRPLQSTTFRAELVIRESSQSEGGQP